MVRAGVRRDRGAAAVGSSIHTSGSHAGGGPAWRSWSWRPRATASRQAADAVPSRRSPTTRAPRRATPPHFLGGSFSTGSFRTAFLARPRATARAAASRSPEPRLRSRGGATAATLLGRDEAPGFPGASIELFRRRPTLPGGLPPSTIGAGGLNFRVRNGNGCDPAAMATGNLLSTEPSGPENSIASTCVFVHPSPRPISTGRLNTLLCVHLRPINVVVWPRALPG